MRSAWANLLLYRKRFAAVLLSIAIGVGFAASTMIFTASFRADLARTVGAAASLVDVVAQPAVGADTTAMGRQLAAVPGVATVEPVYRTILAFRTDTTRGFTHIQSIPTAPALRWFDLTAGVWPAAAADPSSAVAIDPATAERNRLSIGSPVTVTNWDGSERTFTVVGLLDVTRSSLTGSRDELYTGPEVAAQLAAGKVDSFDLIAAPGTAPAALAAAVDTALGGAATVNTGSKVAADLVQVVLGGTEVLGTVLLSFAIIAGLVSASVIANTFNILIHQRQRQIGLWRSIGASRAQVRRSVLAEALLVGGIGATAGLPLAVLAAWLAMPIADVARASLTIEPLPVFTAWVVAIAVTVLAALIPSVRAMKVSPLAALNLLTAGPNGGHRGLVRSLLGLVLGIVGTVGLAAGVKLPSLTVAVGGGAVSAVGVLLLLRSVLSRFLRVISPVARLAGTPGRLAAANALRNPHRAAATATALTISVGLIVTLQVGGASARAGLASSLDERFPLDVSITATPQQTATDVALAPLPAGLNEKVAAAGLTTRVVAGTLATIDTGGTRTTITVLGATTGDAAVVRSPIVPAGRIALPRAVIVNAGLHTGDVVSLVGPAATLELRITDSQLARGQNEIAVVSAAALERLDPAANPAAIWGRLTDVDRANEAITELNPIVAPYATVVLAGSAIDHASVSKGLTTMLLLVTALLAVGAVIGVVGIGNSLGLSVTERTRESALLRALGLRRGQLRWSLAVEAALLAAVGSAVGIAVGTCYGWIGAAATFREIGSTPVLVFPAAEVLLVLVLAVVAGVVASVLPARRAAKAQPRAVLIEV